MLEPSALIGIVQAAASAPGSDLIRMGTIPGTYTAGRPTIIFDGEASASVATYPYLSTYTPGANHRVLLIRAGNTYVVLGRIV